MCRAGGPRCSGSHSNGRATQTTRKAVSRARAALKAATAAGDVEAIDNARARLVTAQSAHQQVKDIAVDHQHEEPASQDEEAAGSGGDVTDPPDRDRDDDRNRERAAFYAHPQVRQWLRDPLIRSGAMTLEDRAREWNAHPLVQVGLVRPIAIPGQGGDVTDQPHTRPDPTPQPEKPRPRPHETPGGQSYTRTSTYRVGGDRDRPGDTVHVTNIVTGNVQVGSQHDVVYGDVTIVNGEFIDDATQQHRPSPAPGTPDKSQRPAPPHRTRRSGDTAEVHNTIGDGERVEQQIGIVMGRTRRYRNGRPVD
ncbi:hypothetical protein [Actinokineospora diospyrosa]|uniref:DUF1707 domain-containing protein n=1 Tax=Actinokineospora diospyrosa TaxID=103728 RepID=A0ABT1I6C0_9PSEU|nr:hypothetical protein [Actinokineospora diospyrosa]MCP2268184.1 hypothetical protein [Actinokineospora diospyrosa]